MTEIAKVVFDHYGARHQMLKLVEELNECAVEAIKAATDHAEDGHFDVGQLHDLASEIADVEFLFAQLRNIPGLADEIDTEREFKEWRQAERLRGKYHEGTND